MLNELKSRLLEISDLGAAGSLLSWDQATYMPRGGAPARSRQSATLHRLAHQQLVDPAMGRLLDALAPFAERLSPDLDDAGLIRVAKRDFEKALKVPPDHVARATALGSAAYDAWTRARPANDFATMLPFLEKAVDLSREYADFFAPYDHVADPLIDDLDEGMTTTSLRKLLSELRGELLPIVHAISDQPKTDGSCLSGSFDEQAQFDFGLRVVTKIGYDLERGQLDRTHHPFCAKFSLGDVRITTRVYKNDVVRAFFATVHEAGHAIYEQGISSTLEGTPLGRGRQPAYPKADPTYGKPSTAKPKIFGDIFIPNCNVRFQDDLSSAWGLKPSIALSTRSTAP